MSDHGDFWGNIFDVGTDILGDWLGTSDGTPGFGFPPGGTGSFFPSFGAPTIPVGSPAPVPVVIGGSGMPPLPPGPPPPPGGCGMNGEGPQPVWKKVCGVYKWVYPKRRRRRQLLTRSDAAGLAQLKGIVGTGKTMDTWIATHPS